MPRIALITFELKDLSKQNNNAEYLINFANGDRN